MSKKWLLSSVFLLLLAVLFVLFSETEIVEVEQPKAALLPPVSMVEVSQQSNRGQLSFYAEVKPRWSVGIKSHVRGEIIQFPVLAGMSVKAGQLLLAIEDSAYQTQYAEAKQAQADAKLGLLEEEVRLKANHKLGSKMLEPRLNVARKALETANSRVEEAKVRLSYTRIRAPFDGYIVTRTASFGQTVEVGEPLLEIINTNKLDIEVNLTAQQWALLPQNWRQLTAVLQHSDGKNAGLARVKRGGGFVDAKTRQYRLFMEIDPDKDNNLLAGEFIQVRLAGRAIKNSLQIPESALTRNGFVWYLDHQDKLQKFKARPLFYNQETVVIASPDDLSLQNWRIVRTPLASFLPGALVAPVNTGGD